MAQVLQVKGLSKVIANLKKEQVLIKLSVDKGLRAGALYVQRESQKRVPVDTGNLKASAFSRRESYFGRMAYRVGYTAHYALFVHEAIGMKLKGQERTTKGRYWDPQGRAGPKFLESVVREKYREVGSLVARVAKGGSFRA